MYSDEEIISIRDLTFSYGNSSQKKALDNFCISIKRGEFIVIFGPSGAGKSTFCLTLNGLIPRLIKGSFSGNVFLRGNDIKNKKSSELSPVIGLVFQDFESQLFSTNVTLEVAFGPENLGLKRGEIMNRIEKALGYVGLKGFENREPAHLSGGEKQRLSIASVLSIEPEILCLDEPTTDLDPAGKEVIFKILHKLKKDGRHTVIVIEHETEEILDADRIILMDRGTIIDHGEPKKILRDVQRLNGLGIMPPQMAEVFYHLGEEEIPFTFEEASELLRRSEYRQDRDEYRRLLQMDSDRNKGYDRETIRVEDLEYSYEIGKKVLDRVSLSIKGGEFIAILGQNGSGKTTLVKHLNGLLLPTRGRVYVRGQDTRELALKSLSQIVGYVFQNPDHQLFAETVFDEVAFTPRILNLNEKEIKYRVDESLRAVGMTDRKEDDPFSLTKGERQRVAVASVLASKPEVLILDEPTTGLDSRELKNMMELLKDLNKRGHTIIMVTHSMHVASIYAHRIIVLDEGRVIADKDKRAALGDEGIFTRSHLKLTLPVRVSNSFGMTLVSPAEFKKIFKRR